LSLYDRSTLRHYTLSLHDALPIYAGNPTLSKDGKTLYFESDMPGGFGESDIWKVSVNTNGTYGKPENLGAKVNTEGREGFPFIRSEEHTSELQSRENLVCRLLLEK